ncbi:MAG: choice-of-anchor tandem repeat GloVer-containing protein [Candidatus Udaeobacter sp.]
MNLLKQLNKAALIFSMALSLTAATGTTTDVIFSFEEDEGEYADTDLETDSAGNIYGTTVLGGDFGSGTVFQLSPTPNGWVHAVLYSFTGGTDGGEPYKGVTLDRDGNLYGTAVTGGSGSCEGGCGVIYKLTNIKGTWTQKVVHAFTGGDDGSGPGSRVTVDRAGNIYGMTPTGGANGLGTIYKIGPLSSGALTFKVIHAFTGGADGSSGSAGRMILRDGHLYGAATTGGSNGSGVIFQLTPKALGGWDFQTIYTFQGQPDGSFPYGALLFDDSGNIYGTTYYGGANGIGAVYKLSPQAVGEWTEEVIYSFQQGTDGNSPISNLVFDKNGNLYGTTSEGGLGSGAIFKLAPTGGGNWTETVVHAFAGPPDGGFSYNGMVVDVFGNFYGATVHGGENDDGSIYKFTP